jgi:hypothetical protein
MMYSRDIDLHPLRGETLSTVLRYRINKAINSQIHTTVSISKTKDEFLRFSGYEESSQLNGYVYYRPTSKTDFIYHVLRRESTTTATALNDLTTWNHTFIYRRQFDNDWRVNGSFSSLKRISDVANDSFVENVWRIDFYRRF